MPSFDEVRHKIEKALRLLYENDLFLITNTTNERSITHKLAEYIQSLFPEWHVDCEYNRKGEDIKRLYAIKECSKQRKTDRVSPDIIIHHRNTKENILVIEAKSFHSNDHSDKHDKTKIKAYIEEFDYQYQFGLWVCFHDDPTKTKLDWFENKDGVCRGVSL